MFLFFIIFFAFPSMAFSFSNDEYVIARKAIAKVESGGNVCAQNPYTSASGKYQFMKAWNPYFQKKYGKTWASVVPKCTATTSVKKKMEIHQDKMFDIYFKNMVEPFIEDVRTRKLAENMSDLELLAIYHRQGERGAYLFLKNGKDPYKDIAKNGHVSKHIARVVKASKQSIIASK
jgi:hypothetical protein